MSEIDLISFTSSPKILNANVNTNIFTAKVSDLLNESFDKSFKFDANNNSANTTFKAQPSNSFIERADNLTQMFSPSQTLSADDSGQDLLNLSNSICEDLLDFGNNNITNNKAAKVPEVVIISDKNSIDEDDASVKDSTDTACLLDNFDFIEVNSAADGEEFWLCGPKNNEKAKEMNGKAAHKPNNPYKWIHEEFENRNLDKVKRTLLVTLDDISKGLTRRSRSVSMTRKPLPNYYYGGSHANANTEPHIDDNNNANTQTFINGSGVNYQDEIRRLAANINSLSIENKSKSIESIIADADTEFDAPNSARKSYDSRTITKKRNHLQTKRSLELADDEMLEHVNKVNMSTDNLSHPYEDLTDVRVVARMQEDSLRQSVININKSRSLCGSINNLLSCSVKNSRDSSPLRHQQQLNQLQQQLINQQQQQKASNSSSRNIYSTIKVGTGNGLSLSSNRAASTQNNANVNKNTMVKKRTTNQIVVSNNSALKQLDITNRSDSLSSEQSMSSISNDSPYNSNINVNEPQTIKETGKLSNLQSGSLASKLNSVPRSGLRMSQQKNLNISQNSINNISSSSSNSITSVSASSNVKPMSSRYGTPSYSMRNDSRLPTPRGRSSMDVSVDGRHNQSAHLNSTLIKPKSPSKSKPPPMPSTHNQGSNTSSLNLKVSNATLAQDTGAGVSSSRKFNYSSTSTLRDTRKTSLPASSSMNQIRKPLNQQMGSAAPPSASSAPINSATITRSSTVAAQSRISRTQQQVAAVNVPNNAFNTNSLISFSPNTSPSTLASMPQPMTASSPRSRGQSPSAPNHYQFSLNNAPSSVTSPSGLLTNGPISRNKSSLSPSRAATAYNANLNGADVSSSMYLQAIKEATKIPTPLQSPSLNRKNQVKKSLLPQPTLGAQLRRASPSPNR